MTAVTDHPTPETTVEPDEFAEELNSRLEETTTHLEDPLVLLPLSGRTMRQSEIDRLMEQVTKPFPENEVEKLPKSNKGDKRYGECKQGSQVESDRGGRWDRISKDGVFCGKRHPPAVHLDYIGHAGITMRLNQTVGPADWGWEFMHIEVPEWVQRMAAALITQGEFEMAERIIKEHGQPIYRDGGIWIKMTILNVTKIGFGDAQEKSGPNATKEIIGDAIRNAGLRFGIATYLWGKSEVAERLKTDEYQAEVYAAQQAEKAEAAKVWDNNEDPAVARGRQDNAAEASQTRPHPNSRQPEERQGQTHLQGQAVEGQVQEKTEGQWYAEFLQHKADGVESLRSWGNLIRGQAPKIVLNAIRKTIDEMETEARRAEAPVNEAPIGQGGGGQQARDHAEPASEDDMPPLDPDVFTQHDEPSYDNRQN